MSFNFSVKGLGKIEDATININPLTVITGPNGTGKSFFTKMAYSIFRMIEDISLSEHLLPQLNDIIDSYNKVSELLSSHNLSLPSNLEVIKNVVDASYPITLDLNFNNESQQLAKINQILLSNLGSSYKDLGFLYNYIPNINFEDLKDKVKKPEEFKKDIDLINSNFQVICSSLAYYSLLIDNDILTYEHLLTSPLENEIKENFQIELIGEIINEKVNIESEGIFSLSIDKELTINIENLNFFKNRPSSVFFESPAYWRVRDALVAAKMKSGDDYLSGVPKYFFDLDSDLRKKSKVESDLLEIHEEIKQAISGEFIFSNGAISFEDEALNHSISKNLVSFGMTNLGMLNALIKNNVIKKGSYVFIDEPETNLHPDWQVLMIKVLTELSRAGVNVIITTHSTEILKYIEVRFQAIKDEEGEERVKELLSVNYLDTDGTSLEFDSECPIEQTKEALAELSSPFFDLYMEGK